MRQATVYYINYYANDYNVARYEVLSTVPSAYYCNCFFTDNMYYKPPQHITLQVTLITSCLWLGRLYCNITNITPFPI
jgi:hypothetical protein